MRAVDAVITAVRVRGRDLLATRSVTPLVDTRWRIRRGAPEGVRMCRHDGLPVSAATVLRLLRGDGLLLEANYQCPASEILAIYLARNWRTSSAVFVQTNGFGSWFQLLIQART